MAYESMTYENILERMMQRVTTSYPNLDTREGSIIFNALAPAAMELAIAYVELDNVLAESFVETASREYLYLACDEMGMDTSIFEAHAGKFKGEFDVEVPIGSRWNCDLYNYTVDELIEQDTSTNYYEYSMTCETLGAEPNSVTGSLTAITDLPTGLTHAELTACLVEGEDEYTDEEIKTAYYEFINATASDGNVGQYERWCAEYEGIGNYKVLPLWAGNNTVKVSILSASNKAASSTLIDEFQEYLDPGETEFITVTATDATNNYVTRTNSSEVNSVILHLVTPAGEVYNYLNPSTYTVTGNTITFPSGFIFEGDEVIVVSGGSGMGNGVAPIGAFVTVTTATEKAMNITARLTIASGYSSDTVEQAVSTVLTEYFASIAYKKSLISYMNVGAAILAVDGVAAIANLTVNSDTVDIYLGNEEIPVLGTTSWMVVPE